MEAFSLAAISRDGIYNQGIEFAAGMCVMVGKPVAPRTSRTAARTCLVIHPMGFAGTEVSIKYDNWYHRIIVPALKNFDFSILRLAPVSDMNTINQGAIQAVLESDLVIADISDAYSNVMYELGVRHATRRPAILTASTDCRLPFDLASIDYILYSMDSEFSIRATIDNLRERISRLDDLPVDSPIVQAMNYSKFATRASDHEEKTGNGMESILKSLVNRLGTIEEKISEMSSAQNSSAEEGYSREIFIVHGHDGEIKTELARLLERLGFDPIILHEQADRGQTIAQKLHRQSARAGFVFVIHAPDDEGRKKGIDDALQPRSRQNVIFEHGMFIGAFGHARVCALVKHNVEIPSDLHGVTYKTIPPGGGIQSIAYEIVKELKAAGYVIDANKIL